MEVVFPSKRRCLTAKLHGVQSQKTAILINTLPRETLHVAPRLAFRPADSTRSGINMDGLLFESF
jgi:hypothetical protein